MAGYVASASFTPAASAYSLGDIFEGAKEFAFGGAGRNFVHITGSTLLVAHTALVASEAGYTLHLYSVTPPSALADNAGFDVPVGDRASYLGSLALGTPVDLGASLFIRVSTHAMPVMLPAGGSLFAYLATDAGITPTAAARTVTLFAQE